MTVNAPVSAAGRAARPNKAPEATARGAFQFIERVENERRNLRWVSWGETIVIKGLMIPGGVYVGKPQFQNLSFAIDPDLPLGEAEKAEPLSLVYGEVHYWRLTNNQRAFYLRWLRGETNHIRHVDPKPYFRLYLAGLEWHFLVDGDLDDSICDLACDLAERDQGEFSYHALALLSWWGQLQRPEYQFIVVDEAVAFGFRSIPSDALALALANLAVFNRNIPIALSAEVALQQCTRRSNISLPDLRVRVRERLSAIYPGGFPLPENECTRLKVRYRPICPELNNDQLLAMGSPLPSVEIPDLLKNPDLAGPLERLTASIIAGPVINPGERARVASENADIQKFLADRTPIEPEDLPPVPPVSEQKKIDLTAAHRAALEILLTKPAWSEAEFGKVAEEFRLRVPGLRSVLNRWAQEHWGDLLLEGSDLIQLNQDVIKQMREKI